jgi:5-methylcytosine-specific restriction endonuclease McrA
MKLKPCITCGRLTSHGSYCQRHQPRNGSTRAWRHTRAQVLARTPSWAVCGQPAEHVGHITPLALGGTDHPSTLKPLCARHNLEKGDR